MISRDRSGVMVNVFRCERKAFNSNKSTHTHILLAILQVLESNFNFEKQHPTDKTDGKHVIEFDFENGADTLFRIEL